VWGDRNSEIEMLLLLHVIIGVCGCLLLYIAIVMKPDEEGNLQNRIETLWITVNDKQQVSGDRTTALFNRIAGVVSRTYNRILGVRLISVQMVGVSSASSLAGLFLGGCFVLLILFYLVIARNIQTAPNLTFIIEGYYPHD
jgi:hypothetical protein